MRTMFAAMAMAMAAASQRDRVYGGLQLEELGAANQPDCRQLREFSVKGKKVMAYSKKDAIKRIKHQIKKGGEK